MSPEFLSEIRKHLIRDEGLELKPYKDTMGKLTIGVGRNLDDRGITEAIAMQMLDEDVEMSFNAACAIFSCFKDFSMSRQLAIVNMLFNLGETRFRKFEKMIAAINKNDWSEASAQAMASGWGMQVPNRARRIANLLRDG